MPKTKNSQNKLRFSLNLRVFVCFFFQARITKGLARNGRHGRVPARCYADVRRRELCAAVAVAVAVAVADGVGEQIRHGNGF